MSDVKCNALCSDSKNPNKYIKLPESDAHWRFIEDFMEPAPDEDYEKASEEAYEAFRDMKYGVRIHWGLYSMLNLQRESWPFLKMSNEEKQSYQQLYTEFNPEAFNAEEWMEFFKRAGFKCFAFTTKHHEGFSMFDTKAHVKRRVNWTAEGGPAIEECDIAYSVMDTPFKRDIVKELCDAAHKNDIKIDLYFSHPDWYDADFRPYAFHPLTTPDAEEILTKKEFECIEGMLDGGKQVCVHKVTGEETNRMIERHRQQLVEILTNYGKIDMLCLDNWLGRKEWAQTKETIKILRKIQPDVMFRARGIGHYGDYYTPEGFVPGKKENTDMPWMVIYPLAATFSYDPDDSHYKECGWVIKNLIDTAAKGGNFMVGIGPDGTGTWHHRAVKVLEEVGEWLRINGEAIYGTRARNADCYKEGENVYYTAAKDKKYVYAITTKWPVNQLSLRTIKPATGSQIFLLGHESPLRWDFNENDGLTIWIPDYLQEKSSHPCSIAYSFKIIPEKNFI